MFSMIVFFLKMITSKCSTLSLGSSTNVVRCEELILIFSEKSVQTSIYNSYLMSIDFINSTHGK